MRRPRWTYGKYDHRRWVGRPSLASRGLRWAGIAIARGCQECKRYPWENPRHAIGCWTSRRRVLENHPDSRVKPLTGGR